MSEARIPEDPDLEAGFVAVADQLGGQTRFDPKTGDLLIDDGEGGTVVHLGRKSIPRAPSEKDGHFENLAEKLDDDVRNRIVDEVLRGIEADEDSRRDWLETRAEIIEMLGTKLERPRGGDVGNSTGPFEGMSTIRHPLLLESVVRFQANAAAELYPPTGPVKVRDDRPPKPAGVMDVPSMGHNGGLPLNGAGLGGDVTAAVMQSLGAPAQDIQAVEQTDRDALAEALEFGFNHNLTSVDRGYRPNSVQMLFWIGLGGCGFKKVYDCPIRRRPISRYVDAKDVIVDNNTAELGDAGRITHRIIMRPSVLKRMQLAGSYRKVDLHTPQFQPNPVEEATAQAVGLQDRPQRQEDQPYTIYESCVELDVPGYHHMEDGEETGLPLPYKVTIDKDSRVMLELRRNWEEDDDTYQARRMFVKFGFIPAMGFYDLGLMHLLGNGDRALTAAWREALDCGMYGNFPAFLFNEGLVRNWTNQNRAPPGGGIGIKGIPANVPLRNVIEPLPYKDIGAGMVALIQHIEQRMDRVAGTAELPVGEGRQDAPVGTTLALIEQATKVLAAVHIGLHAAQAEELELLKDRYRANPESFWRFCKKKTYDWEEGLFLRALEDCEIVPAADPNTPSHMARLMKWYALVQLAIQQPMLFNLRTLVRQVAVVLGISDPDNFLATQEQINAQIAAQASGGKPPGGDPARLAAIEQKREQSQQEHQARLQEAQIKLQQAMQEYQARIAEAQADAAAKAHDRAVQAQAQVTESADRAADRASRERVANTRLEIEKEKIAAQDQQHQRDTFIKPHVEAAAQSGLV